MMVGPVCVLIVDGESPSPVKAPTGKQRKLKRIMDSDDEAESPVKPKPEAGMLSITHVLV